MLHTIMGFERALPWLITAFFAGYAIGSVPFGILVSRAFGLGDLRQIGSGNIGATNVLRTGSKPAAALTLCLDMGKGWLAAWLFLSWGDLAGQAAGIGAVMGHCLPVWLRFRGGKAVATALGVGFGLFAPAGALACAVWLAVAAALRISSVAGMLACASVPVWMFAFGRLEAVLATAAIALWVVLRHNENIVRLFKGTEPKIGQNSADMGV